MQSIYMRFVNRSDLPNGFPFLPIAHLAGMQILEAIYLAARTGEKVYIS